MKKRILSLLMIFVLIVSLTSGCTAESTDIVKPDQEQDTTINNVDQTEEMVEQQVSKDGAYTTLEDVAEYIHLYGELPKNFITKKKAMDLGWESEKGNLWDVTDKGSIGGDSFGNREGLLPKDNSRKYFECDINYNGGFRGAERIVYSNDGLIYYTKDHYNTFEKIY